MRLGPLLAAAPRWTFAAAARGTARRARRRRRRRRRTCTARSRTAERRLAARSLAAHPRCFGAAARDPRAPVHQPDAAATGRADADRGAQARRNAPCTLDRAPTARCTSARSARRRRPKATVALIGDSHASHWRAALDFVARAQRLARALAHAHELPALQGDPRRSPSPTARSCTRWNAATCCSGSAAHPEVAHVFVSQLSGGAGVVARRARPVRRRGRRLPARLAGAAALGQARSS